MALVSTASSLTRKATHSPQLEKVTERRRKRNFRRDLCAHVRRILVFSLDITLNLTSYVVVLVRYGGGVGAGEGSSACHTGEDSGGRLKVCAQLGSGISNVSVVLTRTVNTSQLFRPVGGRLRREVSGLLGGLDGHVSRLCHVLVAGRVEVVGEAVIRRRWHRRRCSRHGRLDRRHLDPLGRRRHRLHGVVGVPVQ